MQIRAGDTSRHPYPDAERVRSVSRRRKAIERAKDKQGAIHRVECYQVRCSEADEEITRWLNQRPG